MKQFLRFQISGTSFFLWLLLYLIPFLNFSIIQIDNYQKLLSIILGFISLALPIGTIIHQTSISIYSPVNENRFLNIKRKILEIQKYEQDSSYIVFCKAQQNAEKTCGNLIDYDMDYIREHLSSLYSYYYVRIDNGFFAPIFAFTAFIFIFVYLIITHSSLLMLDKCKSWILFLLIVLISFIICILLIKYIPQIYKEIDDIEIRLSNLDRTSEPLNIENK